MFTGYLYVLSKEGVTRLSEEAKLSPHSMRLARLGHFCYCIYDEELDKTCRFFCATRPNARMIRKIVRQFKAYRAAYLRKIA